MSIDNSKSSFQPKDLSPEELAKMRAEVEDKITVARVGMLLRHPFFGNMANFSEVEEAEGFADLLFTAILGGYDKLNASDLAKFMYPDHKVSSDGFIYVKK